MLPVHLSDIQALKEKDPNIWQFYLDECFSVLINCIPGTTEDVDHAGQQEKKKLKIQVVLVGITRPENSMNKLFLLSHVFSEIENKRREMYHSQKKKKKINHALNQNIINMQSKNTISLAATFGIVKLQFTD